MEKARLVKIEPEYDKKGNWLYNKLTFEWAGDPIKKFDELAMKELNEFARSIEEQCIKEIMRK